MRGRASRTSMVLAVLATACSPAPLAARHTVEEYRANAELRHMQIARCRQDPGSLKKTPDCINAEQAAAFEDRLRLRDAPPVGLGPTINSSHDSSQPDAQEAGKPATSQPEAR